MPTVERLKKLVLSKLQPDNTSTIYYSGKLPTVGITGRSESNAFIFCHTNDGWTVYNGCELLVGDTSLDGAVACVLDAVQYRP